MSVKIGFMSDTSDSQLRFIRQAGITDVVTSLRGEDRGDVWAFEPMLSLRKKVEDAGLKLSVFEGIPVPDRAKLGLPGRDEDIDNYCESLRNMGRAGITVLCYNWMVIRRAGLGIRSCGRQFQRSGFSLDFDLERGVWLIVRDIGRTRDARFRQTVHKHLRDSRRQQLVALDGHLRF